MWLRPFVTPLQRARLEEQKARLVASMRLQRLETDFFIVAESVDLGFGNDGGVRYERRHQYVHAREPFFCTCALWQYPTTQSCSHTLAAQKFIASGEHEPLRRQWGITSIRETLDKLAGLPAQDGIDSIQRLVADPQMSPETWTELLEVAKSKRGSAGEPSLWNSEIWNCATRHPSFISQSHLRSEAFVYCSQPVVKLAFRAAVSPAEVQSGFRAFSKAFPDQAL